MTPDDEFRHETCKHCGEAIRQRSTSGARGWTHTTGKQTGMHRCALDPYGYDAAPDYEPCSFACRGSAIGE